ncbi:hypothetical protein AALB52_16315 [Lachnospiraceae bacterium 38-14]
MTVIAILDIDEEQLAKTGNSFNDRMGRLSRIGIQLREYRELERISEYEYAAFVWDVESHRYEQMGRPVHSENLCRARFNEYVEKDWFTKRYDTSRVVFKKRLVSILCGEWEEIKED